MTTPLILFVGPLPPPLHGFSFINGEMLARCRSAATVAVFNRAAAPGRGAAARLGGALQALARYAGTLLRARAGAAVYVGFSGGLGQLMDLPFLAVARLLGRPVVIHHHSFAYLRQPPWHTRLVLGLARQARHITLCDCMADALVAGYGIPRRQVAVVSNAAFLSAAPAQATADEPHDATAPLRLGFLSNITAEKGIFAFFDLCATLVAAGQPVRALIAGPVADDIAPRFAQALAAAPHAQHLGAVYGADKDAFYAGLDVLVFPTFYANEAEPVTVLEALRAGVPVLANARGCLADLVPADAGRVLHDDARFVADATAQLQAWQQQGAAAWQTRRQAARAGFARLRDEHAHRVEAIVQALAGRAGPAGADR